MTIMRKIQEHPSVIAEFEDLDVGQKAAYRRDIRDIECGHYVGVVAYANTNLITILGECYLFDCHDDGNRIAILKFVSVGDLPAGPSGGSSIPALSPHQFSLLNVYSSMHLTLEGTCQKDTEALLVSSDLSTISLSISKDNDIYIVNYANSIEYLFDDLLLHDIDYEKVIENNDIYSLFDSHCWLEVSEIDSGSSGSDILSGGIADERPAAGEDDTAYAAAAIGFGSLAQHVLDARGETMFDHAALIGDGEEQDDHAAEDMLLSADDVLQVFIEIDSGSSGSDILSGGIADERPAAGEDDTAYAAAAIGFGSLAQHVLDARGETMFDHAALIGDGEKVGSVGHDGNHSQSLPYSVEKAQADDEIDLSDRLTKASNDMVLSDQESQLLLHNSICFARGHSPRGSILNQ